MQGRNLPVDPGEIWEVKETEDGFVLLENNTPTAFAKITDSTEFNMARPCLQISVTESIDDDTEQPVDWENVFWSDRLAGYAALLWHAGSAFDKVPGKYPLYLVLDSDSLGRIAAASRMGLIPYFGAWKDSTADESESVWNEITENLRTAYPEGIDLPFLSGKISA